MKTAESIPAGSFRIMVIDDEKSFLLLVQSILEDAGYAVRGFHDPVAALKELKDFSPHLLITDMRMPVMNGLRLVEEAKKISPKTEFMMITAFATIDSAVEVMKKGALDYITKPLKDPEQLRQAVLKIRERQAGPSGVVQAGENLPQGLPPSEIIFAGMEKTFHDIQDVAATGATVIIHGETGTGKSLIARVLHQLSGRRGPFVDINCAAIPESLLESELFGYERGAFTGAANQKKGRFELANDGSIFLDEVSEMSLTLQAKFLRVLQEKTFERLGAVSTIKTNARIIAATNRDLKALIAENRFREDLYYRLSVYPVFIPPLRQRKNELPAIAEYLVGKLAARIGRDRMQLDDAALQMLKAYDWPGNIRELENVLERSLIKSRGERLSVSVPGSGECGGRATGDDMKSIEKSAIEAAIEKTGGSRKAAAGILGISLRALQYKIKHYGIAAKNR